MNSRARRARDESPIRCLERTGGLVRQTNMKVNPRIKQPTKNDRNNLVQNIRPPRARQQRTAIERRSAEDAALVQPARGLLICFGWLRLFQQIVAPSYAMAGRKGLRHAR